MTAPPARDPMRHYARSRAWCEWEDFEAWKPLALAHLSDQAVAALSPFHLLALPGISAAQQRHSAERWMAARLQASAPARELRAAARAQALPRAPAQDGRLRIGYLSSDFHQHATALLMVEMLEAHDRTRFALHAYSQGADDGRGMRQRLAPCFEQFTDTAPLDDEALATRIEHDGIDILVDLKGFTADSRSAVLGWRPAPVQVSFLGYPGTLGGTLCDYLVSDRFVTPTSAAGDYSEALACLPHSYQPHARVAAPGPGSSRTAAGLPADGFVFCCFNQAWKFTPEVFDIWCGLLRAVDGSVLWLLHSPQAEGNLRREALARGVDPRRLVFAPEWPQAQHLARLPLADLVLDTLPYNAHTTASDALAAGVPVLTCAGQTFAARVAGSLLQAVGLPELVTHTLVDYAALALALARDAPRLAALRARLADGRDAAPLFDVAGYTHALEALYQQMWARHRAGLPPASLGDMAHRPQAAAAVPPCC